VLTPRKPRHPFLPLIGVAKLHQNIDKRIKHQQNRLKSAQIKILLVAFLVAPPFRIDWRAQHSVTNPAL
jgi:hypothetical protein